jgi:hypothetical protein
MSGLPSSVAPGERCNVTGDRSSIVPERKVPAGRTTVPPLLAAVSTAAWIAAVSRVVPSPRAPKSRTSKVLVPTAGRGASAAVRAVSPSPSPSPGRSDARNRRRPRCRPSVPVVSMGPSVAAGA